MTTAFSESGSAEVTFLFAGLGDSACSQGALGLVTRAALTKVCFLEAQIA